MCMCTRDVIHKSSVARNRNLGGPVGYKVAKN